MISTAIESWCDAVRTSVRGADSCDVVFDRTEIFRHLNKSESSDETITRLGWHGNSSTFLSSGGHDWWLYQNHGRFLRHPGVYIDLATNDPIARNNNFFTDRCLGWRGICVEPNPFHHERIRAARRCDLVPTCISNETDSMVRFGTGMAATFGGSAQVLDHSTSEGIARKRHEHTIELRCVTLSSVLQRANVKHVDFLSLDVEGHELSALQSLDFARTTVDIIMVETLSSKAAAAVDRLLVDTHGYRKLTGVLLKRAGEQGGGDPVYLRRGFQLMIERERNGGSSRHDHAGLCAPIGPAGELIHYKW